MRAQSSALLAAAAVIAGSATFAERAAAADSEARFRLSIGTVAGAAERHSEIVVTGSAARYDRVTAGAIRLPVALSAEPAGEGSAYRLIASNIALKTEGAASATDVPTLEGDGPARSLARAETIEFRYAAQGSIAEAALNACNGLGADERPSDAAVILPMRVAVRWQVTSGRFTFKWTDYDRVAPSDAILRNPDFYADHASEETEGVFETAVRCEPLANAVAAPASKAVPAHTVERAQNLKNAIPVRQASLTNAAPPAPATSKPLTTVAAVDTSKPRCDGGMVRALEGGDTRYLCLCPGNTTRTEIADNAFACERRARRN